MRLLCAYGADVNLANRSGSTPIHGAVYKGNPECLAVLYESNVPGFDPFLKTKHGYTAIELAAEVELGHLSLEFAVKQHREGKPLPGLNLDDVNPERLLHCAANSDRKQGLDILLTYYKTREGGLPDYPRVVKDLVNRALLRKSE